jgi:hypothetical protein
MKLNTLIQIKIEKIQLGNDHLSADFQLSRKKSR